MSDTLENLRTALAGRYQIERQLGSGGMATVYLARDLKHGRQVAIKVLRPELAAVIGARRFLHEIATVAVLQHPRILGLIDSGEANGTAWYVMPYVDGESLRDRLEREKQLSVPEAVRITTEVGSALDYAHRQGIVHRDIKPENILLQDGQALVADFGIALALGSVGGDRITETGLSLGTPHYMSPEQATGERDITARSDIFSLGVVTYEMLAGDPPFTGSTAQAVIGKLLADDPVPLRRHRRSVPEHVDEAVGLALEKLPADRFATATAFTERLAAPTGRAVVVRAGNRAGWVAGVALLAGALGVLAGLRLAGSAGAGGAYFGRGTRLSWQPGLEIQPAISPDGRFVAYAGGAATSTRIFVRQISGGRVIALSDDSTEVQSSPTWSPDGTRILYLSDGAVFSAPASGGPARQEVRARAGNRVLSAEWSWDGRVIAFAAGDSLFLQAAGDTARFVTTVRSPNNCRWSPDSRMIACASGNAQFASIGSLFGNLAASAIVTVSVPSGNRTYLTDSTGVNQTPIWSPDGREVYFISNRHGPLDIYRVPASGGEPSRLTTGLGVYGISLSADGAELAYSVLRDVGNVWSLPAGPEPVHFRDAVPVTTGTLPVDAFSVSRDGVWLLYSADLSGNGDLYRMPAAGGAVERLTTNPGGDFAPDLSPGSRPELAFHSWRGGTRDIYVMPLDGGPLQTVAASAREEVMARWSPDASAIVFAYFDQVGGLGLVRRRPDGTWSPPVLRLANGGYPSWSPDGRLLTYTTDRDGGSLMVIPVDSGPPRAVIDASRPGMPTAGMAFFSPDGSDIFFMSPGNGGVSGIWRVPLNGGVPRRVVAFDDPVRPVYHPFWALRNNRLFFTVQEQHTETWVMDLRQP